MFTQHYGQFTDSNKIHFIWTNKSQQLTKLILLVLQENTDT